jgi:hypothetical protein
MARNVSRFNNVNEVQKYFTSKRSKILAIIDRETEEEIEVDRIPYIKEKVKWTCAANPDHIVISSLGSTLACKKDELRCRSCAISKAYGGDKIFDELTSSMEGKGWQMVSDKKEYKNCHTKLKVICPNQHSILITQNHFMSGHGCKECAKTKQRKHTIEDVKREFKKKGYVLLEDEYINNSTLMRSICKCGRERYITYSNFVRNIDGCKECTRRWTRDGVVDFLEENGCTFIDPSEDEFILNSTSITYLCVCGNEYTSTWRLFKNGARCKSCTFENIRQTCLEKYGVDNPSKSEEIKKKIVDTIKERYGVEYIMNLEEYRDKAKKTNINNHGGKHNLSNPKMGLKAKKAYEEKYGAPLGYVTEHIEKAKQTNRERYGVDYPFQSTQIHTKVKNTNLEKYGNEVYLASEQGKQHMIDKYGFPYATQNPEIFEKARKSSFSLKDYTMPSGKVIQLQGYEGFAIDLLLKKGVAEDAIKVGIDVPSIPYTYEGVDRIYYPDIHVTLADSDGSEELLVEVKSEYTYQLDVEKNIAKFNHTKALYPLVVCVFRPDGTMAMMYEYI